MSGDRDGRPGGPSRRGLLKAGLAAGAVAGTGAWSSTGSTGHRPRLRQPGSLPYPQLPAGTDTIPRIQHIVVLMMENHSYDNKLGMLEAWTRASVGADLGTAEQAGGIVLCAVMTCASQQPHVTTAFVRSASTPGGLARPAWCARR